MNGGTRLSYYNYTTEVNNLHIYLLFVLFYVSMLTYLFIIIVNLITRNVPLSARMGERALVVLIHHVIMK